MDLIRQMTRVEIRASLQSIKNAKAPDMDGFNVLFFKKAWPVIGLDIEDVILDFFDLTKLYKAINCVMITLIPLVKNSSSVREFRTISCCTVLYKIISKILTGRLQPVMSGLVDYRQTTFVPGRLITDNIAIIHDLVKGYGRKIISPRCMMKIDMRKAYDSVEWLSIEQMLRFLGFSLIFTQWIMECMTTVSYSVVVNGKHTNPFPAKKVLSQGDPISPFLFLLAMEYLSRLLKPLQHVHNFKYQPRCAKINLIHLGFANDLLLFCKGRSNQFLSCIGSFRCSQLLLVL